MSASFARNTGSEIVGTKRAAVNENVGGISDQIYCIHQDRETVLQGEVKTPLRERFFAKRSARGANCLSPKGEFLRPQRSER
jgi:hypothetical protein